MSQVKSKTATGAQTKINIAIGGLLVLYLVSRLAYLLRLPAFIDEATHILWAQEMLSGNLAAGAYDGRWTTIQIFALASLIPGDPLLITRLVVVAAGLFTMIAIMVSAKDLFSKREGLIAGFLYVIVPFGLFFDRLALADGLSLAFAAWTFSISIKAVLSAKSYHTVALTLMLLGCILTKTSGIVAIIFPLAAVAILLPRERWRHGLRKVAPAVVAALIVTMALWIRGAGSSGFFEKTSGGFPFDLVTIVENSATAASWYLSLLTPIVAVACLLALIWLTVKERTREILFLDFVLLATLLPNVLLFAIWYPRYLLFTLIPLYILLSRFVMTILRYLEARQGAQQIGYAVLAIIGIIALGMVVNTDFSIVVRPDRAPLAEKMRWQYLESWPSGYGVAELVEYLVDEAAAVDEGIFVMRFFNWDQPHQGVNLNLLSTGDATSGHPIEFIAELEPDMLVPLAGKLMPVRPTYVILDRANSEAVAILEEFQPLMDAQKVWDNERPGGNKGLEVWKIHALLSDDIDAGAT